MGLEEVQGGLQGLKRPRTSTSTRLYLAALSRVAINLVFSCLIKKPNKPKKAKDLKLQ